MQEETTNTPKSRGPLTPLTGLLVAGALLAGGLLFWSLSGDTDPAPIDDAVFSPVKPSVIDVAEAQVVFERLNGLRIKAYRTVDPQLVERYIASDTQLAKINRNEIRTLLRDGVSYRPELETIRVSVTDAGPTSFKVRHKVRETPRFVDDQGKKLGRRKETIEQETIWTVVLTNLGWRLADAQVLSTNTR